MPHGAPNRMIDKAAILATSILAGVTVIVVLYWAQKVLIPVALALLFAFVLTPIVIQFQHWGLNRVIAVCAVTFLLALGFVAFGWLLTSELGSLGRELPGFTKNIKKKLQALDELSQNSFWPDIEAMLQEISKETKPPASTSSAAPGAPDAGPPVPVVVEKSEPLWLQGITNFLGPVAEVLTQTLLVIVLVIFILLNREDLRNRFIRLVGHGRLTVTTKAVDDASHRLSRFLLTQLAINTCFGISLAIGLSLFGLHYALLWGLFAAVLRYVPYLGTPIAALFPIALSIAQFDSWTEPILIAVLYLGLEIVVANVIEPWLFGHSVGVHPLALLIAAATWAFLWGPVGLVLSCPLTVCLVVLGKYVPQLGVLNILLSDEPALGEDFAYYQRLAARDEDEAADIALDYIKEHPIDEVYDAVLIPALVNAGRDSQRQGLEEDDVQFIHEATRGVLSVLEEARQDQPVKKRTTAPAWSAKAVSVIGVPARGAADALALEMLGQLLKDEQCEWTAAGPEMLSSEILTMLEKLEPAAICIAAMPPGGVAKSRFLIKRLRARFPNLHIVVGRWGVNAPEDQNEKALKAAGADSVRTTLLGTRDDLLAWFPVFADASDQDRTLAKSVAAAS